jgi:hypothetical protein
MSESAGEGIVFHTVILSAVEMVQDLYFYLTVILCHFLPLFYTYVQAISSSALGMLMGSDGQELSHNHGNKNIPFF